MSRIGDRVGAILKAHDHYIEFLGYGIYEGDFVPHEACGQMANMLVQAGVFNPRIRLDNGKIVYGCECWWGVELKVKKILETARQIIHVDIDQVRAKYREGE